MSAQVASARQSTRELPKAHLVAMRAFLRGYSGILNFNYKVRPNGGLCMCGPAFTNVIKKSNEKPSKIQEKTS